MKQANHSSLDCFYLFDIGLDRQALTDSQKRSDHHPQDLEKTLQPFTQMMKTLKDSMSLDILISHS